MRRIEQLLPLVADMDNLYWAFWKASKGKRYANAVLHFQNHLEKNIWSLQREIQDASVTVGRYHFFRIFEPKERKICAAGFREQVLHHALMNVCHSYFDERQISDSYACRKGKGSHAALDKAARFQKSRLWYLKLDIKKYFETLHHDVLKRQLSQMFKDPALLSIFFQIIDSYQSRSGRGLPIGNLTSQYFANHYLVGLDREIKEQLRIKAYVRYMDDMVLWHQDKTALKGALSAIESFVHEKLQCELKPPALQRTRNGLPFLGYHIFPYHIRLTQQSKQRFIKKMTLIDERYHSGEWDEAKCRRHVLPLIDFTRKADTYLFRKNVLLRLEGQSS